MSAALDEILRVRCRTCALKMMLGLLAACLPSSMAQAQEAGSPPPVSSAPVTSGAAVGDAISNVPLSGPIRRLDVLRIIISGTELGGVVRVDTDGSISLPRLGQISVVQKKTVDAARAIASRAKSRRLLQSADVAVYIVGRKAEEVSIYGAINLPGRQPLREDMVLSDAIETSNPQLGADLSRVVITRRGEAGRTNKGETPAPMEISVDYRQYRTGVSREAAYNPSLKDGDRVFIYQLAPATQGTIRLTGEVKDPTKALASITQGDTAVQVLQGVGGLSDLADRDRIVVVRQGANGKQERFPVPYDAIVRGDRSKDVTLQRGDEIVIPRAERIRQISISGAVRDARPIPYRAGITLQEAIATAGGLQDGAREKDIEVSREVSQEANGKVGNTIQRQKYNLTKTTDAATILQDGDIVTVPYPRRRDPLNAGTVIGAVSGIAFLLSVLRR